MKLAVTGKGGVGKTTISALLAVALRERGREVIAIDADPDSNLAACLGYPDATAIRPLVELKDLIEERTGAKPGTTGGMFRLNPFVEDIPSRYAVDVAGVKVLVAGGIKHGGAGCYCPENALLRALISHLLLERDTALVLDMEAGIEHLSRGTVSSVDSLLMVANPSRRSVETAQRIVQLAGEIGLRRTVAIGNMVRDERDRDFLKEALPDLEWCGFVPYQEAVRDADRDGQSVLGASPAVTAAIREAVAFLDQSSDTSSG